jgi:hypothetical protein
MHPPQFWGVRIAIADSLADAGTHAAAEAAARIVGLEKIFTKCVS